jgi:hypothetical protein
MKQAVLCPTMSRASETMSSVRLRIGGCAASRLVSSARAADPDRRRLSQ